LANDTELGIQCLRAGLPTVVSTKVKNQWDSFHKSGS